MSKPEKLSQFQSDLCSIIPQELFNILIQYFTQKHGSKALWTVFLLIDEEKDP